MTSPSDRPDTEAIGLSVHAKRVLLRERMREIGPSRKVLVLVTAAGVPLDELDGPALDEALAAARRTT